MKFHFKTPSYVKKVIQTLRQNHFEAYIVGGAVRDLILKKTPKDWDVATNAKPHQVEKIFSKTIATGKKYGTVTVFVNHFQIQVTTYRQDGNYIQHRRPRKVQFVTSLLEDLARRDFTINAMAYDPESRTVIDPFFGRKDIQRKTLRAVGVPSKRFDEDALRIIRAGRFAAQLGFKPDKKLSSGAKQKAKSVSLLSKERIRDELLKLLSTSKPSIGFLWMDRVQVLKIILPELTRCKGIQQGGWHQYDVFNHTLHCLDRSTLNEKVRLALLLHDIAKPLTRTRDQSGYHFYGHADLGAEIAAKTLKRLKLPKETIQKVAQLIKHHLFEEASVQNSDAAVRRFIQRIGDDLVDDLIELRRGDALGCGKGRGPGPTLAKLVKKIQKIRKQRHALSVRDLALDGHQVMKVLKIKPGPQVGEVLKELLASVLENPGLNTPNALKDLILKPKDNA